MGLIVFLTSFGSPSSLAGLLDVMEDRLIISIVGELGSLLLVRVVLFLLPRPPRAGRIGLKVSFDLPRPRALFRVVLLLLFLRVRFLAEFTRPLLHVLLEGRSGGPRPVPSRRFDGTTGVGARGKGDLGCALPPEKRGEVPSSSSTVEVRAFVDLEDVCL